MTLQISNEKLVYEFCDTGTPMKLHASFFVNAEEFAISILDHKHDGDCDKGKERLKELYDYAKKRFVEKRNMV